MAVLLLYAGQSSRTAQVYFYNTIGTGWNGYTSFGVGDWDRDGHQDLIARNNNHGGGPLTLFPGQSKRTVSTNAPVRIGEGWHGFSPFGLTDWDRDGHQDLMTRNDASQTLLPGARRLLPRAVELEPDPDRDGLLASWRNRRAAISSAPTVQIASTARCRGSHPPSGVNALPNAWARW